MTTFLFGTLPTEIEKMIVQTATTKKNKVALNKQLNNMRKQFYEDEFYDDKDWVAERYPNLTEPKLSVVENAMRIRQNINFFNNFIEPCRRRLTVGGEVEYWDMNGASGDYFVSLFRTMNYDTPVLRHTPFLRLRPAEDHYNENDYLNTYMILREECIWH